MQPTPEPLGARRCIQVLGTQPGLQPENPSLDEVPARLEEWDGECWRLVSTTSSADEVREFLGRGTASADE